MVGRPRKWQKGYRTTTIMIPAEYEEVWDLAKKVAEREGKSLSELVFEALIEYLNIHGALNPQATIEDVLSPVDELELAALKAKLKHLIRIAPRTEQAVQAYGQRWVADVLRNIPKARRLWARSGDKELGQMIKTLRTLMKKITGR